MRRFSALAAVVAILGAACGGGSEGGPEFGLRVLGGGVETLNGDGWEPASDDTHLSLGDQLRTTEDGWAMVSLPGNQSVELAPETTIRLSEGSTSDLLAGSVLVTAPRALGIGLEEVEVRGVGGLFRVDRGFQYQVRVYDGVATIPGSGWEGEIPPLREVVVVGGSVPAAPQPVTVNPEDRWDERIFEGAIDIGLSLEKLQRGLGRQLPGPRVREVIASATPPPVPARVVAGQLLSRPVSQWAEVFVAAVAAGRVEVGLDASEVLLRILALRDLGASWIVIAEELGLSDGILAAIGRFSGVLTRLVLQALAPSAGGGAGGGGESTTSIGGGSQSGGGDSGDQGGGGGKGPKPPKPPTDEDDTPPESDPDPDPDPTPPPTCAPGDLVCGLVGDALGDQLPDLPSL